MLMIYQIKFNEKKNFNMIYLTLFSILIMYFFLFILYWSPFAMSYRSHVFLYNWNQLIKISRFEFQCLFWFKCRKNFVRYSKWRFKNLIVQFCFKKVEEFSQRFLKKNKVFSFNMINRTENPIAAKLSIRRKIAVSSLKESNWRCFENSIMIRFSSSLFLIIVRLVPYMRVAVRVDIWFF